MVQLVLFVETRLSPSKKISLPNDGKSQHKTPRPDDSQASPRWLLSLALMSPKLCPDVSQASPRWLPSLAKSLRLLGLAKNIKYQPHLPLYPPTYSLISPLLP